MDCERVVVVVFVSDCVGSLLDEKLPIVIDVVTESEKERVRLRPGDRDGPLVMEPLLRVMVRVLADVADRVAVRRSSVVETVNVSVFVLVCVALTLFVRDSSLVHVGVDEFIGGVNVWFSVSVAIVKLTVAESDLTVGVISSVKVLLVVGLLSSDMDSVLVSVRFGVLRVGLRVSDTCEDSVVVYDFEKEPDFVIVELIVSVVVLELPNTDTVSDGLIGDRDIEIDTDVV
jgi:hypothetical protein